MLVGDSGRKGGEEVEGGIEILQQAPSLNQEPLFPVTLIPIDMGDGDWFDSKEGSAFGRITSCLLKVEGLLFDGTLP